jgi:hypothetical protein
MAHDYDDHIHHCSACGAEGRRYERLATVLSHTPRRQPPADLWMGVRARLDLDRSVRGYSTTLPVARPARSWWSGVSAAVAGFACALAFVYNVSGPVHSGGMAMSSVPSAAVSVSLRNGVDTDSPVADAASSVAVDAATVRPLPDLAVSLARFAPDDISQPSFINAGGTLR